MYSQIQKSFIEMLIDSKALVKIYTMRGIGLTGRIVKHDDTVVLLDYEGEQQMIYKQSISTISEEVDKPLSYNKPRC